MFRPHLKLQSRCQLLINNMVVTARFTVNSGLHYSVILLTAAWIEHARDKEAKKAVFKLILIMAGVAVIISWGSNVYDPIIPSKEISLKFVEFLSGKGWRLNEIKSSGSVSLLPKKKDYADTYYENDTNMAQALEKRAYDLVGELWFLILIRQIV